MFKDNFTNIQMPAAITIIRFDDNNNTFEPLLRQVSRAFLAIDVFRILLFFKLSDKKDDVKAYLPTYLVVQIKITSLMDGESRNC